MHFHYRDSKITIVIIAITILSLSTNYALYTFVHPDSLSTFVAYWLIPMVKCPGIWPIGVGKIVWQCCDLLVMMLRQQVPSKSVQVKWENMRGCSACDAQDILRPWNRACKHKNTLELGPQTWSGVRPPWQTGSREWHPQSIIYLI